MTREKLRAELMRDEGVKLSAYQDSLGFTTIGIGRLIDARKGGGIALVEAMYLLDNDITNVERAVREKWPWYASLDDVRQRVICNMAFNLGIGGLSKFVQTLTCIQAHAFGAAAERMLQSRWATQTGQRAIRLAEMMRTGTDPS